ncbi:MAG: hypothetical protein IPM78_14045 [Moraxellaceae bacterium]|nr:hypothetical protein [Moraxellaceae bacterium]
MLRPQKGQHIAIEALALLKEKGVKASLHLFGQVQVKQIYSNKQSH